MRTFYLPSLISVHEATFCSAQRSSTATPPGKHLALSLAAFRSCAFSKAPACGTPCRRMIACGPHV